MNSKIPNVRFRDTNIAKANAANVANLQTMLKNDGLFLLDPRSDIDAHASCLQVQPDYTCVVEPPNTSNNGMTAYYATIHIKLNNQVMIDVGGRVYATDDQAQKKQWSKIKVERITTAFLEIAPSVFNSPNMVAETVYDMLFNFFIAKSHCLSYSDISLLDDLLYDCEQSMLNTLADVLIMAKKAAVSEVDESTVEVA